MQAVGEAVDELGGIKPVCEALRVSRATYYRHLKPTVTRRRPRPPRALSDSERRRALGVLNSERFVDVAPAQVHAILLDEEGEYSDTAYTPRMPGVPGGARLT